MNIIRDEWREIFENDDEYIHIESKEQAEHLFEIFYNTYGIRPGSLMAKEYMYYCYMFNDGDTIEGSSQKPDSYYTYSQFIETCCITMLEDEVEYSAVDNLI